MNTRYQAVTMLHRMDTKVIQPGLQDLEDDMADASLGLNERDQDVLDLHMRHGLEGDDLAAVLEVSNQERLQARAASPGPGPESPDTSASTRDHSHHCRSPGFRRTTSRQGGRGDR